MTQRALGLTIGVSQQRIAKLEASTIAPKIPTLQRLAAALNVGWLWLAEGGENV